MEVHYVSLFSLSNWGIGEQNNNIKYWLSENKDNFYILYDTSDIANKISNKLTSHMQEDLMDKLSQLK